MLEEFRLTAKFRAAGEICSQLRRQGHAAYLAGGCVRDLLLHRAPLDYDVATSARPEQVLAMFERTQAVGAHFGVVLVQLEIDHEQVLTEVATFRNDGSYSDGRRPDSVSYTDDPRQDVQRRDFTINGMLLDPDGLAKRGDVTAATLDFVGGRDDLAAGIVRAIGDPALRFAEDKLRMLRGVRFAARFGFALDPATQQAMQAQAPRIHEVSPERIRDELTRMLTEGRAARAFALLDETGLLEQLLPEISRMKGVEQMPDWHPEGDVFVHTLLLLEKLPSGCSPTLAWGALLHDVGKPPTFERVADSDGVTEKIRFRNHAQVGERMAAEICRRLRFSIADTQQIEALVHNHMRFGDVLQMKESTLKRFFRLREFNEHLALHRLDALSSSGNLDLYEFARRRYQETPPEVARPVLYVTGKELIAEGYRPGREFQAMLAASEDAQLEGRIHSTEDGLALVREMFGAPVANSGS